MFVIVIAGGMCQFAVFEHVSASLVAAIREHDRYANVRVYDAEQDWNVCEHLNGLLVAIGFPCKYIAGAFWKDNVVGDRCE